MTTAKLTALGDGLGFVLPPELLAEINGVEGEEFAIIKTANGLIVQRADAEIAKQIEAASRVIDEDREVLRKLAE